MVDAALQGEPERPRRTASTAFTGCSRVPDFPHRYVQHVLEASTDDLWDLLQHDAATYVCGNASTMAPGVRTALAAVFRAKTGTSQVDADAWLAGLRSSGRYLEDIWGETALVWSAQSAST